MGKINIGIADDHKVFREGIISLFSQVEDMDIVLEASGGQDLLERLAPLPGRPHIILLDIEMPDTNGFEVQKVINKQYPDMKTICFSAYDNEHSALKMFRLGTMGFLSKGSSFEEIKKLSAGYKRAYTILIIRSTEISFTAFSGDINTRRSLPGRWSFSITVVRN